jgi:NADPH:quinone reductase-like Zn-dependent oxidoreductase
VEAQAMRQIWITKFGPPEVLAIRQAPDPEPKPGEVRIRVEASGVNFADIIGRVGFYPDLPPIPVVPGYEVSGRIDAVGAGIDTRPFDLNAVNLLAQDGHAPSERGGDRFPASEESHDCFTNRYGPNF